MTEPYDALGRLVTTSESNGNNVQYTLDSAGNRTQVQSTTNSTQPALYWEAESLPHQIGYAEPGAWAADTNSGQAFMTYGPYTTAVPVGNRVAVWRMKIDNPGCGNTVLVLDVEDPDAGVQVLNQRTISCSDFATADSYMSFEVPFTFDPSRAGHRLEFRTFFYPRAHVSIDKISVH